MFLLSERIEGSLGSRIQGNSVAIWPKVFSDKMKTPVGNNVSKNSGFFSECLQCPGFTCVKFIIDGRNSRVEFLLLKVSGEVI